MITKVFDKDFASKQRPKRLSPMQLFISRNRMHPLIEELSKAEQRNNMKNRERLFNKTASDGWGTFLRTVSRSNTKAFYAYLAETEGRKRWVAVPTESVPIFQEDTVILGNKQKCEAVAKAFYIKLQEEAELRPEDRIEDPNELPLPPFQEKIPGVHRKITIIQA